MALVLGGKPWPYWRTPRGAAEIILIGASLLTLGIAFALAYLRPADPIALCGALVLAEFSHGGPVMPGGMFTALASMPAAARVSVLLYSSY